jgi:hypothetical protein
MSLSVPGLPDQLQKFFAERGFHPHEADFPAHCPAGGVAGLDVPGPDSGGLVARSMGLRNRVIVVVG